MKVRDLMTTGIRACHPEDTLADATTSMWKSGCDLLPVVDWEDHVVGQISDDNIRLALRNTIRAAIDMQVSEAAAARISRCSPDDDLDKALESMQKSGLKRMVVVNADDTLAGLLDVDSVDRACGGSAPKLA